MKNRLEGSFSLAMRNATELLLVPVFGPATSRLRVDVHVANVLYPMAILSYACQQKA